LRNIGASVMHLIRCFAVGGFKINGPSIKDKGPMESEEYQEMNKGASPSRPTQAGRIETCTELISKAMRCLENNDKQCAMRLIGELVKANCHDGRLVGGEIANHVRDAFHELWLISDNKTRCEILSLLRDLGISRRWIRTALNDSRWLRKVPEKCGFKLEGRVAKNKLIEEIEDLMKRELGWTEESMCRNLLRFIGIDIDEFERHGIDVCAWLRAETSISYLVGIIASDIADRVVKARNNKYVKVSLSTTEAISAVIFPLILSGFGKPSVVFFWSNDKPKQGGSTGIVAIEYYINVGKKKWKWLDTEELVRYIKALKPEEVPKLIAGYVDGDGTIYYNIKKSTLVISIAACKACEKRALLNAIQEALRKLGIESRIYEYKTRNGAELRVYGKSAIELLRLIVPYLHHPIKRLRAELILMLRDGKIDREAFTTLYGLTKYGDSNNDPKRYHAVDALTRAAPQTHTHGNRARTRERKTLKIMEIGT